MIETKELDYGKQLSRVADNLKIASDTFTNLFNKGYRSDDNEALDKFIDGLSNAMNGLTKLIQDQATIVETAIVMMKNKLENDK